MKSLQLQDIHLPDSASLWPLAAGWWILIAVIIAMSTWGFFILRKRAKQKKQQKIILSQFETLEKQLKASPSNATIAEINTLLRQLAINYFPRAQVASLTGGEWLHFLDSTGDTLDFSRGAGRILIEAPYQQDKKVLDKKLLTQSVENHALENLNLDEFIPLIRNWANKTVKENTHG